MNVLNKFLFFLIIFSNLGLVFSFNVCNVDINEPWFIVNDSLGNDVLIVDNQGDIYFEGQDHSLNNVHTQESFEFTSSYFNHITSYFNSFSPNLGSIPVSSDNLVIQSDLGNNVAAFDDFGNIYTLGSGVYEGSQAGCFADGTYCNGQNLEIRDYFCDITASKVGSCDYSIGGTPIDCLTKSTIDSDGGVVKTVKGTITDFTGCIGNSCDSNIYTDICTNDILTEYSAQGSSYTSQNINCLSSDYYECAADNLNLFKKSYPCNDGACASSPVSIFIETCAADSTDFGTWNSCPAWNVKARTNIEYSAHCFGSSCSQSSSNVVETQTCPGGNYCSGGSCNIITYSWDYNSWSSCIGSCGSSTGIQSRSAVCRRDFDNTIVSDSYCGTPTLTQSCSKVRYTGTWVTYPWSSCSGSCGTTSTSTRVVSCSDSCCNPATKPATSQSCTNPPCPINCDGYWDYNYGSCSVSCGGGNYDAKWYTTTYPANGGSACPSTTFVNNGGNICNDFGCPCSNPCTGSFVSDGNTVWTGCGCSSVDPNNNLKFICDDGSWVGPLSSISCCSPTYSNYCSSNKIYQKNSCTGALSSPSSCTYGCTTGSSSCNSPPCNSIPSSTQSISCSLVAGDYGIPSTNDVGTAYYKTETASCKSNTGEVIWTSTSGCVECNTISDCYDNICIGGCNRCVSHICAHGDNNDVTPEELALYKELVKENKDLIIQGKISNNLH